MLFPCTADVKRRTAPLPPEASRLNSIDIREFDPDELRTQVGAMFQDYVTYQATAKENIGLTSLPEMEDHRGGDRGVRLFNQGTTAADIITAMNPGSVEDDVIRRAASGGSDADAILMRVRELVGTV
jgi:hypothetical protein